jgi:Spy/CpxP family protein refolding chaperone
MEGPAMIRPLRPVPTLILLPMLVLSLVCVSAVAQDGPPPDRDEPRERGDRDRGPRGDMLSRMLERDPTEGFIFLLAELNMTPQFTLSPEQKTKIQDLRETFRAEREAFVAEHEKELDYIRAQMTEAREARDREAMGEAFNSLRDLMSQGPSREQIIEDIKAVLTDDQRARVEQRIEQRERRMREWRERRQRGREQRDDRDEDEGPAI